MSLMIKDLKSMAAGTEVKGFPLLIKTARGTFSDGEENIWQECVFMDSSGEIVGHILQDSYEADYKSHKTTGQAGIWQSKQRICVMEATIQDTDIRKKEGVKIVITECFDLAVRLTFDQRQELSDEEWRQLRQDEIKGKIRHGLVCVARKDLGFKGPLSQMHKQVIHSDVDFIMTGE